MKKFFLLIAVICASFEAFCDGISMDDVFKSLTSAKVTAGDFIQEKTAAKLKRPLKSTGNFIFSEDGILWQTLKPFPSTMAVTKTSIIQTKPDGTKTVTDGSANEVFKSVAQTLSSLFSGSRESLESFFIIEKFNSSSSEWKMVLTPKDKTISQALKTIELGGNVKGSSASLDSMKIIQSETESTSYILQNQIYRQELTNAEKALFK